MSDIKLFRTANGTVDELEGKSVAVEKSIQQLIENHLEAFLGVRFLASEFSTGPKHGGRIDTLGLDENDYPVIIEYKRAMNQNVINQGLFYLDWLMDHQADFELLVMNKLDGQTEKSEEKPSKNIDWSGPRLLCIAGDFNKYDEHAIQQINRNIELLRYQRFGDELLLLDLISAASASARASSASTSSSPANYKTVTDYLSAADQTLTDRYEAVRAFCTELGDDVQEKTLKYYIAFKRLKNFACVEIHPTSSQVVVYVKADFENAALLDRIEADDALRDVQKVGHYGTGNLELRLKNLDDFERTQDLIRKSYERS